MSALAGPLPSWLAPCFDTIVLAAAAVAAVSRRCPRSERAQRLFALYHVEVAYGPRGEVVSALAQIAAEAEPLSNMDRFFATYFSDSLGSAS